MDYVSLICCVLCCLCNVMLLFSINSKNKKQRIAALLVKIKKGLIGMKKETMLPLLGKKIVVRDLFGNVEMGKLENVDDDALTIVNTTRKSALEKIIALEYISSVEVEK